MRFYQITDPSGSQQTEKERFHFPKGQGVRIVDGPFTQYIGTVSESDRVDFFFRQTNPSGSGLTYDAAHDLHVCPHGQPLRPFRTEYQAERAEYPLRPVGEPGNASEFHAFKRRRRPVEHISNCWERYRQPLKVQSWLWPLRPSIRGRTHPGYLSANAWALGKASIRQEGMGHLKGRGAWVAFAPIP